MKFGEVVEQAAFDCTTPFKTEEWMKFAKNFLNSLIEASDVPKKAESLIRAMKNGEQIIDEVRLVIDEADKVIDESKSITDSEKFESTQKAQLLISKIDGALEAFNQLVVETLGNKTLKSLTGLIHGFYAEALESLKEDLKLTFGHNNDQVLVFITTSDLEDLCNDEDEPDCPPGCCCQSEKC